MATDFYPPFIGGAERQTYLLSRELAARGHQVSVATVWHEGLPERQEDSGVHVHRLKGMTTRVPWFSADPARRYHPPFPEPAIVLGLHRSIKRARPDVVHAGGWIVYSCAAALLGKRIPLLLSVRDYGYGCAVRTLLRDGRICAGPAAIKCLTHAAHVYRGPKAIAAVLGVFGGRALLTRRVDATHAISTYVQRTVARDVLGSRGRIPANRQVTIPDVVDGSLTGGDRARPIQRYLQELPAEPYILFVGALQEHKGVTVLLAAYQRLTAPPPLVLVGTVWPDTPR